MSTKQAAPIGPDGKRVRTAWSDPEHMRLSRPSLEELASDRKAERLREPDPADPWAKPPPSACQDCGCDPADKETFGWHGGAACVNPACPAECDESEAGDA